MFVISAVLSTFVLGADPSGQIAFLSGTEQEDRCVCVLDVAAGTVTRVGHGTRDGEPEWSPDGSRIAFVTTAPEEGTRVCIVEADGFKERLLKHDQAWNHGPPRWSPDGNRLAYTGGEGLDRRVKVYDLEADREIQWGGNDISFLRTVWTGDDRILAVGVVGTPGKQSMDLYWVTQDGATPATEVLASVGTYAEWSPEPQAQGEAIAYESNDGGDREIFVYLLKRGTVDVSNHRAADWNPVWSPDGEWVAFESFRGGRRGIYRVSPLRILVSPIAVSLQSDNWAPTWSPDGAWVAFVSDRDGVPKLYVTDVAGEDVRALTKGDAQDLAPAWRPEVGR